MNTHPKIIHGTAIGKLIPLTAAFSLFFALLGGFPTPAALAQICVAPPSGLVSWWDGDAVSGTTASDIQDANDGTLTNGATTAPGQVGNAFSFDGVNDVVVVGNPPNLQITGPLTVDAWVNLAGPGSSPNPVVLGKWDDINEGTAGYILILTEQGGGTFKVGFFVSSDGTNFSGATATTNLQVGTWYHLAGVFDGSSVTIYVDGVLEASAPHAGGIFNTPADFEIGADDDAGPIGPGLFHVFNGLIDEVEIYDRALSASEIQAIFNAGSAGKCKPVPTLLVSSFNTDEVLRYDGTTGAFIDAFVTAGSGGIDGSALMIIGPDGNFYIGSGFTDEVLRYDGTTGAFIDVFVTANSGGLNFPHGLAFGPDGNLYVSSFFTDEVLRYDGTTGAFLDVFASSGGLSGPAGLVFGPDGNLYVNSFNTSEVLRYDGTTGAFIDVFVPAGSGGLFGPTNRLEFGPDGNLYIPSFRNSQVLRYDGTTGAFIDAFVPAGSGGLSGPQDAVFGPDGNLYVASHFTNEVLRYDGTTGAFIDVFASGGLSVPVALSFSLGPTPPPTDTTPPTVSDPSTNVPAFGVKGGTIVNIQVRVEDPGGVSSVLCHITRPDGTSVVLNMTLVPGTTDLFTVDFTPLVTDPSGTYDIEFEVTDNVGNTGTVAGPPFTVDNQAPSVPITTSAASTGAQVGGLPVVSGAQGQSTAFSVTAGDATTAVPQGGIASVKERITDPTGAVIEVPLTPDGTGGFSGTFAPAGGAPSGVYTVITIVVDLAGNITEQPCRDFLVDNGPPTLTFGTPSPAANAAGWNKTNVSIPFTPSDALSGVASTSPAASPLVLSAEGAAVTGSVTVTDVAGNSATFTSPAVNIDKTPPAFQAPSTSPSLVRGGQSVVIEVTVRDDGGSGVVSALCRITPPVGPVIELPMTPVPGVPDRQRVVFTPLPTDASGNYQVGFGAEDTAGNGGTAPGQAFTVDNDPPVITNPSSSAPRDVGGTPIIQPGESVDLSATVTDQISGVTSVEALVTRPDGSEVSVPLTREGTSDRFTGQYSASGTDPGGLNTVKVKAKDGVGNPATLECKPFVTVIVPGNNKGDFRTIGFWKHQFSGKGKQQLDDATLTAYLEAVRYMSHVFDEQVPLASLADAKSILSLKKASMKERATQQLLASWLNFAHGAAGLDELVDTDFDNVPDTPFAEALSQMEAILLNPGATDADFEGAKNIADSINNMKP